MTEPTDAELDELRQANSGRLNFVTLSEFRTIARAVLEKWGNPAVAGEQVGWMWQHDETGRTGFVDCWQVENGWQEGNPRLRFISKLYAPPQPTQAQAGVPCRKNPFYHGPRNCSRGTVGCCEDHGAKPQSQAGAVPLTDEQLAEMMRETWGCASIAPRHAMKFARAIEAAHGIGIKGGQHGTE